MIKGLVLSLLLFTSLLSWDFTKEELDNLNAEQIKVLNDSFEVGNRLGIGYDLVALAIVETRAGLYQRDTNKICGVHQVSTFIFKQRFKQFKYESKDLLCEIINENPRLSAKLALLEFNYWSKQTDDTDEIYKYYNAGWNYEAKGHGDEFARRMNVVLEVLMSTNDWILKR